MASTGTADNMNAAVTRLTHEDRAGLRFDRVDPFAPVGRTASPSDSDFDFDLPADDGLSAPSAAPGRTAPVNGKRRRKAKARKPMKLSPSGRKLRKLASPVLMALAIGLVVPAVWSVLVLLGFEVAMSDHEAAKAMAGLMLICWPLAAFMAIAAGWMIRDLVLADRID